MAGKVIVLGGGVAGLSAAHELVERGFTVEVFDRGTIPGGKARSVSVPGTGTGGRPDLPGEHGFRFFPGFYRHLPDTMKRIPYGGNDDGVYGNLRQATQFMLARQGQSDPIFVARFPTSLGEWYRALKAIITSNLGIPAPEAVFFLDRLMALLTSCHARRFGQWEHINWWEFIRASEMSPEYRAYLAKGLTRSLVAMRAEEGSTRTVGYILLQLLFDLITPGQTLDRLLDGPTNEVWIDPWVAYLQGRGATYHLEHEVKALHVGPGAGPGSAVRILGVEVQGPSGPAVTHTADWYVLAMPVERVIPLLSLELVTAAPELAGLTHLRTSWMNGMQFYLKQDVKLVKGHAIFTDSPWALTSISQQQFWAERIPNYGDGQVHGILSIDISDWDTPGILYNKAARDLTTRAEIKDEVWAQLKAELNDDSHPDLQDSNLAHWFLDPSIDMTPSGATNDEPLLVNIASSWQYRPEAVTSIPNLFLASDYVRTYTDLATMEGASEAARRAVNGVLRVSGSSAPKCGVWPLWEPWFFAPARGYDARRWEAGKANLFALDFKP
ncbi:MAG: FAD-dependent oxidoreductase [Polyangiaceae bacterium]